MRARAEQGSSADSRGQRRLCTARRRHGSRTPRPLPAAQPGPWPGSPCPRRSRWCSQAPSGGTGTSPVKASGTASPAGHGSHQPEPGSPGHTGIGPSDLLGGTEGHVAEGAWRKHPQGHVLVHALLQHQHCRLQQLLLVQDRDTHELERRTSYNYPSERPISQPQNRTCGDIQCAELSLCEQERILSPNSQDQLWAPPPASCGALASASTPLSLSFPICKKRAAPVPAS